ncbi:outer membrane beta-barrel protein [Capnocytophaga canis]|uniref:outer membrane beta-barrel protein n=1 Tax=Capnocytophaga canis TaxID=1848903 RepID=UPI0037D343EF
MAQSRFQKGFKVGYKEGWCYDKGVGCIPPIPPIAPIPRIGEDMNNYQDGYRRGFTMGQQDGKKQNSYSNPPTRQRYQTSEPVFIDLVNKSNNSSGSSHPQYNNYSGGGGGNALGIVVLPILVFIELAKEEKAKDVRPIVKFDISGWIPKQEKSTKWAILLEIKTDGGYIYNKRRKRTFLETGLELKATEIDNISVEQISVPATLKYKMANGYIIPKAGIYLGYNIIKDKRSRDYSSVTKNIFDIGTNIGLEFRIGSWIIDANYNLGFINIIQQNNMNYKNNDFRIGFGIAF